MKLTALLAAAVTVLAPAAVLANPFDESPFGPKGGKAAPAATAQPTPAGTSSLDGLPVPEMMAWEMGLAENAYIMNKNVKNEARLLNIYEKVTVTICMPNLNRLLAYDGNPQFPRCLEFIDKTLKIDPANPVAICARDGLSSSLCRAASETQDFSTYNPGQEERLGIASLDDVLSNRRDEPERKKKTDQYLSEVQKLERAGTMGKKFDRSQLRTAYNNLIAVNCRASRVVLKQGAAAQDTKDSELENLSEDEIALRKLQAAENQAYKPREPDSILLRELDKDYQVKTAASNLPKSRRTYQVTSDCHRYIEMALKFDKGLSAAVCHRYGFYSPHCIDAKLKEGGTGETGRRQPRATGTTIDSF